MKQAETRQINTKWHNISADNSLRQLEASTDGLTSYQAEERLKKYGENRLPEGIKTSNLKRFFLQFHNILIYILIGCALVTVFLNHLVDAGVILAVVIINAIIGYIQEGKAQKAMDAIRHMLALHANVIRDGRRMSIGAENLVPGDIVLIEAGDKVPADLRLINVHGLFVQEAILTGESVPVEKHTKPVKENAPLGDRSCMLFSGTLVTSGQGSGVVVATGNKAEIGRISGLLSKVETLTTPLVKQMSVFSKWLTVFILFIAFLLLVFGYFIKHYDFTEIFMAVIGLSVAAIPEGLPAVLTITLAVGVKSMAKRNAIVRHLPAIETLGSVSVICTDKTGTLTRNEMMVSSLLTYKHLFTLEGDGYIPKGILKLEDNKVSPSEHIELEELARAATLCNDAQLVQHGSVWTVEGDPMEGALLTFAQKIGLDIRTQQMVWKRTDAIAFDANHRFMATLNHNHENQAFIFVKGAPERILSMCNNQQGKDGKTQSLNIAYWNNKVETIAALGQRVLAFAVKAVNPKHTVLEHKDVEGSLTLLGMVGMIDPPRSEAILAILQCKNAGIDVKMITGDHAKTALAIGKQIGLQNFNTVLTGTDLDNMSDDELKSAVLGCDIFARTSPEHKLRLVMALQSHSMIVAMTGDGVNDAPALKRADVGIAMGKKGSEATKEVAKMVLVDDNFASIVDSVREGRTVYDNIKKVISFELPTNGGEAMCIIVALLFGMTLPITAIQILWINLITAVTLGLALAFEPTEANTMSRPPRKRNEPLLSGELIWHIALVSFLFSCGVYGIYSYAIEKGYSVELARTIALNTLVVMEIFHLFFIRNIYGTSFTLKAVRGTKVVWLIVIIIAIAQFAITYLKPLQAIFSTVSVPFWDGVLIIAVGIALFVIVEIEKQIRLYFKTRQKNRSVI
ncbi:MAG: cation-transporting P-type ATPase [Alphaproteobacteria bacterium]